MEKLAIVAVNLEMNLQENSGQLLWLQPQHILPIRDQVRELFHYDFRSNARR